MIAVSYTHLDVYKRQNYENRRYRYTDHNGKIGSDKPLDLPKAAE